MTDYPEALKLLENAEAGMRSLMARALDEQRYQDVAAVAPLAESVAKLIRGESATLPAKSLAAEPASITDNRGEQKQQPVPAAGAAQKAKKTNSDDYPRFERDRDKLVKIGWSKKDRREYEHRAPRSAVFAVAATLSSIGHPGKVFAMEDILPVKGSAGDEIPSYQAYLALAWFRHTGAVEERGKDGYAVARASLTTETLTSAWDNLPQK
jgi:hypothetical protein